MIKKLVLVYLLLNSIYLCEARAQVSLSLVSKDSLTPNSNDTIGAFSRIFYHPERDLFYLVYAARLYGQPSPAGVLNQFSWLELDASMSPTGNEGFLPGLTGAGDFAMVMVDTNYYHLTVETSGDYLLTKYNDDFALIDQVVIPLDPCESNIDQLLNYTNNRLVIGAMYDGVICPPINPPNPALEPYSDIYQYDLDLNEITPPILLTPSKVTWGASMIYNGGYYYEITMDHFDTRDLYAYKYDAGFNYISSTLLDTDGQWSQGVLYSDGYYFVAFHTGDHNHGNIKIEIYDVNWNQIYSTSATSYLVPITDGIDSYNANRPYLLKLGNKLYLSYDVESYTMPVNNKDWQAHVDIYQINGLSSIDENKEPHQELVCYPNPADNEIRIETNETNFIVNIRSSDGKLVKTESSQKIIYTNDLQAGAYIIELITDTNKQTAVITIK